MKRSTIAAAAVFCVALFAGLAGSPALALPDAPEEMGQLLARLSAGEEGTDEALAADLEKLSAALRAAFAAELPPPAAACPFAKACPLPKHLRQGLEIPRTPNSAEAVGCAIADRFDLPLAAVPSFLVKGSRKEMSPSNYAVYERGFEAEEGRPWLEGRAAAARAKNQMIVNTQRNMSFKYRTRSLYRTVRHPSLPGGAAHLYWETILDPAERIRGKWNAYLDFLLNMEVYLEAQPGQVFKVAASWAHAGGSFLFIHVEAGPGDIAEGVARSYDDLRNYLPLWRQSAGKNGEK